MKKVLVIAYHFPPEGGTAVQRISKFVKYLPLYGYQPVVLTAGHRMKKRDESLAEDIPADVRVFRVRDWGAMIPYEIRRLLLRNRFVPDSAAWWERSAVAAGCRLARKENAGLVFSTSPPHSVQVTAGRIAQRTGLPWIADFRDEWTTNSVFPKTGTPRRHRELEQEVLHRARMITTVGERAAVHLNALAGADKVRVIRNGYDPDDMKHQGETRPADKRLHIMYAGRFNRLHAPDGFLHAVEQLHADGVLTPANLAITILGGEGNRAWLRRFPSLEGMVTCTGYVPHRDCLDRLGQASALLLLATGMGETEMYPAKMYEYFAMGKPVLALVSYPGELSDMLKRYGCSYIGYENRPGSLKDALLRLAENHREDCIPAPDAGYADGFSRRLQAGTLAGLFDQVTT